MLGTLVADGSAERATGVVQGRVVYRGQAPPPVFVPESGGASPVLRVDRDSGGMQYAIVYIDATADRRGKPLARAPAASRAPVTVVQRGFIFDPPVIAVVEGQGVRFTNEDSSNHNVRSADVLPRNRFNAYTGAGEEYVHRFARRPDGEPIILSCDIHEWMAGWIYVFDHPWFAVTDRHGRFRIDAVPAGTHTLAVRQPAGGMSRDLPVNVRAGVPAAVELTWGPTDLKPPR